MDICKLFKTVEVSEVILQIRLIAKKHGNTSLVSALIKFRQEYLNTSVPRTKFEAQKGYEVVCSICENISADLLLNIKDKFVRIMYFVLEFFFEKEMYEEVINLSVYILPSCQLLQPIQPDLYNIYRSLASLFTNKTLKLNNQSHLPKLVKIALQLQVFISENDASNISRLFNLITYFCQSCFKIDPTSTIFMEILELLSESKLEVLTLIPFLFQLQLFFVTNNLDHKKFIETLKQILNDHPEVLDAFTIAEDITAVFNRTKFDFKKLNRIKKLLTVEKCFSNLSIIIKHLLKKNTLNNEIVSVLSKILVLISQENYGKCDDCESRSSDLNLIQNYILILKFSLTYQIEHVDTIFKQIVEKVLILRSNSCTSYPVLFYNASVTYFNYCTIKTKSTENRLSMVRFLSDTLFRFHNPEFDSLKPRTLYLLATILFELNQNQNSGEVLTILAILYPDFDFLKLWLNLKLGKSMIDLILSGDLNKWGICLGKIDLIKVALFELALYYRFGGHRNSMLSVCKYVCSYGDRKQKYEALRYCWQIGLGEDGSWSQLERDVKLEKNFQLVEEKLQLATLHVLKYTTLINKIRQTNLTSLLGHAGTCTEQSCFDFYQEEEILQNLHCATELYIEVLSSNPQPSEISDITFDCIKSLHLYYEFHKNPKTIQAIVLCYNYAVLLQKKHVQLKMLCYILEKESSLERFELLVEIGSELEGGVEEQILFLLSQSICLYQCNEFQRAYKKLQEAEQMLKALSAETNAVLIGKTKMLRFGFYRLPCYAQIPDHDVVLIYGKHVLFTIIGEIKHACNQNIFINGNIELLTLLFDHSEQLTQTYLNQNLFREAECYLHQILPITQYLNLPVRTSQVLLYISKITNLSGNIDKSQTHVTKILEIFGVELPKDSVKVPENLPPILLENILLDIAHPSTSIKSESPKYVFPLHKIDCRCVICSNPVILKILFETQLIDYGSELTLYQKTELFEQLLEKFELLEKIKFLDLQIPEFNFRSQLLIILNQNIYKYARDLYAHNNSESAISYLQQILQDLYPYRHTHYELISEILSWIKTKPEKIIKKKGRIISPILTTPKKLEPEENNSTPFVRKPNRFFKSRTPSIVPTQPQIHLPVPMTEKKVTGSRSPNSHDYDRLFTPYKLSPEPPKYARKKLLQDFGAQINVPNEVEEDLSLGISALKIESKRKNLKKEMESVINTRADKKSSRSKTSLIKSIKTTQKTESTKSFEESTQSLDIEQPSIAEDLKTEHVNDKNTPKLQNLSESELNKTKPVSQRPKRATRRTAR